MRALPPPPEPTVVLCTPLEEFPPGALRAAREAGGRDVACDGGCGRTLIADPRSLDHIARHGGAIACMDCVAPMMRPGLDRACAFPESPEHVHALARRLDVQLRAPQG